tara:strand:+ start:1291 stop:1392 length:102 start_codon:yes stop_codon:yes gene_type:complete
MNTQEILHDYCDCTDDGDDFVARPENKLNQPYA